MAGTISPNTVTNGLVLCLDSANAQSYPNYYYNLLLNTQTFSSGSYWGQGLNTTGTPAWVNVGTAPDGTNTSFAVIPTSGSALHRFYYTFQYVSGSTYTFSCYAKPGSKTQFQASLSFTALGSNWRTATFNLVGTGSVASSNGNAGVSPTITNVGNGWYRCTFTNLCTTTVADQLAFGYSNDTYSGDGTTTDIEVWGAQMNLGSTALPYQQITTYTNKWTDLSPSLKSGSLINGTYYTFYPNPTQTMIFDGSDDYVNTTFNSSLDDFSICSWFKNNSSTGYARIADKNYQTGFWFGQNGASANQWGGGVRQTNNFNFLTLSNNDWHFLAMTRTGTSLIVYADGITNTNTTVCGSGAIDTTLLSLGATINTGAGQIDWFKGNIATLQIYNRVLSAAEILQNYNSTKTRFGL